MIYFEFISIKNVKFTQVSFVTQVINWFCFLFVFFFFKRQRTQALVVPKYLVKPQSRCHSGGTFWKKFTSNVKVL